MTSRNTHRINCLIFIAILSYLGFVLFQNNSLESFKRLNFETIAIILLLSLTNYGIRFLRWQLYINFMQYKLPLFSSLTYYLAGFAFTTTPGKAGEAVRSLYLKDHDISYSHSFSMLFAERLSDFLAATFLAALILLKFPNYSPLLVICFSAILLLLTLIQKEGLLIWIHEGLSRIARKRFQNFLDKPFEVLKNCRLLLNNRLLYGGLFLGILAWAAEGVGFYLVLKALGIESNIWLGIGIYSISVIIGAISFIPGGLGSTEGAMVAFLVWLGANGSDAGVATIICRAATLWFAVIIGGLVMFGLRFSRRRGLKTT